MNNTSRQKGCCNDRLSSPSACGTSHDVHLELGGLRRAGAPLPDSPWDVTASPYAQYSVENCSAGREGTGMATKTVFYSFHYERDVHRVQLVRNVRALEG